MNKKKFSKSLMTGIAAICFCILMLVMPEEVTDTFFSQDNEIQSIGIQKKESLNNVETTGEMQVHFLDVGQADSIFIACDGQYMLVDAGNNDDGETIVEYLKEQGVEKLDYVIGTHPHEDHIGSLDTVIEEFEIETLLMPEVVHTTKTFEDVIVAIEKRNLSITAPKQGDVYTLGSGTFTILAPAEKDYGDELNNWSVGILLKHGENAIVLCGDAEEEAETDICNSGIELSADVLKLGHHGSRTSTSNQFFNAVDPEYAVISCGKGNDYGHPHKETLEKLAASDIKVFRTDEQGTIILKSNGKNIEFQ